MGEEIKAGCARPTGGPVGTKSESVAETQQKPIAKEVKTMVTVGKKAPDFTAPAYYQGKSFPFSCREHLGSGRTVFLPRRFTFV